MKKRLGTLLLISLMVFISITPALADSEYSLQTNISSNTIKLNRYIEISGNVLKGSSAASGVDVSIKIEDEDGNGVLDVKQLTTDNDGSFQWEAYVGSKYYDKGNYKVYVKSAGQKSVEEFTVIKTSKSPVVILPPKNEKAQETEQGEVVIIEDEDGNVKAVIKVKKDKIKEELENKDTNELVIDASSEESKEISVKFDSDLFSEIVKSGKKLVVNSTNAKLEIDPSSLNIKEGSEIELGINELTEEIAKDFTANLESNSTNLVSSIFDFQLNSVSGDETEKLEFNKPIKITTKFNTDNVSNYEKIGTYYYNEETEEWEYIGGKPNENGKLEFKVNHFSKYAAMEYNKKFEDVDIAWANEAIEVLTARHIIDGVGGSEFAPYDNITRAAFSKLIVEALDLEAGENNVTFEDVESDKWYTESIETAASLGIVTGYDGKFNPNAEISREAMATMVVRALEHVNPEDNYVALDTTYSDKELLSDWSKDSVSIASAKGLINGVGNNEFAPKSTANRAESAVVVYRLLKLVNLI